MGVTRYAPILVMSPMRPKLMPPRTSLVGRGGGTVPPVVVRDPSENPPEAPAPSVEIRSTARLNRSATRDPSSHRATSRGRGPTSSRTGRSASRPASARSVAALLVVIAAVASFSTIFGGPTAALGASQHALSASSSVDISTARQVSLGGTGEGSPGGSAIVENPLRPQDDASDPGPSADEARKIWAVIGGLLLVAVALTILTVRYWRHTRPVRVPSPSSKPPRGRRARRAHEASPLDDLGSDVFVDET